MYSFIYRGLNVQLCRECAEPMYEAVELMKEKVTHIRAIKEASEK
jgi:CRISPR/Cas system-associated endonuclease Cas3-HD